jgi:hypothetical protein
MEVGDEGSRRAIACLIREPANQRGATRESFRLFALLRDKVTCIAGGPMANSFLWIRSVRQSYRKKCDSRDPSTPLIECGTICQLRR